MKNFVGTKTGQNLHLAAFDPQEVLSQRTRIRQKIKWVVGDKEYWVNMKSQRYDIFAKSLVCATCGLKGVVMMLDIQPTQKDAKPHFNLYAIKGGELVLMTKDHIVPTSKGGSYKFSNCQTMCSPCNARKKDDI